MQGSRISSETLKSNTGQVVLVFQGGGALGAYQAGVYEALHEFGSRAGLAHRDVDRRDQRLDHRGQQAGRPARETARVLAARRTLADA